MQFANTVCPPLSQLFYWQLSYFALKFFSFALAFLHFLTDTWYCSFLCSAFFFVHFFLYNIWQKVNCFFLESLEVSKLSRIILLYCTLLSVSLFWHNPENLIHQADQCPRLCLHRATSPSPTIQYTAFIEICKVGAPHASVQLKWLYSLTVTVIWC